MERTGIVREMSEHFFLWENLPMGNEAEVPARRASGSALGFCKIDIALSVLHSRRMAKPALGRGLGALLGGSAPPPKSPQPAPAISTALSGVPVPAVSVSIAAVPATDQRDRVLRVSLDRVKDRKSVV